MSCHWSYSYSYSYMYIHRPSWPWTRASPQPEHRAPSNEGDAARFFRSVGGDLKTGAISTNSIPQDDAKK